MENNFSISALTPSGKLLGPISTFAPKKKPRKKKKVNPSKCTIAYAYLSRVTNRRP
jgi:hypothetical protein